MKIQESAENYLETILVLKKRLGTVRSIDIAHELGYSKPSISYAMKNFRENGLITQDEHGFISLTAEGLSIAEKTYERHQVLCEFFMMLGVDQDTAEDDACRIEHVISEATFLKLKEQLKKNGK